MQDEYGGGSRCPVLSRPLCLLVLALFFCSGARAEPAGLTPGEFAAQVTAAQHLAGDCRSDASACNPAKLPADAEVQAADGRSFRASWFWLREAVAAAKGVPAKERAALMTQAVAHLEEIGGEAAAAAPRSGNTAAAEALATRVLARGEFQTSAGPTWIDRQVARLQDWVLHALVGMNRLGSHYPWLAPATEWACFLLAAGGLLFFVRRSLTRQALRVRLGEAGAAVDLPGRETTDWARLATEHGAAERWREGIHCLYWAAIASLEGRRAWRPNPTRTPREYLRLLPAGSEVGRALKGLTARFERVWYGKPRIGESDFRAAQGEFERILAADLRRADPPARTAVPGPARVGAA